MKYGHPVLEDVNELMRVLIETLIRERDEARADPDSPHPCHADLIAEARALLDGAR